MIINHANLQTLFTGFKTTFRRGLELTNSTWRQIAMEVPSSTELESYDWLGMHPRMKEWLDDRIIESIGTHGYTIRNRDWENTFGVQRNKIEDDKFGIYSPMIQRMGEASALHPDELVYSLLNDGTTNTGYDEVAFFSASHPHEQLGTVSNVDSGGAEPYWYLADLSKSVKPFIFQNRKNLEFVAKTALTDDSVFFRKEFLFGVDARYNAGYGFWQYIYASNQTLNAANFEAALVALWQMQADNGLPLTVQPTHLIVPTAHALTAERLLGQQFLATGESNINQNRVQVHVSPFLSNT